MTKSVALFMPMMADGGAERVMLNLAHGIAARGDHTAELVLAKPSSSPRMEEIGPEVGVRSLDARRTTTSLPALTRYLRKHRPDVMISALASANMAAVWAKRVSHIDTRVIVTQHNTLSEQVGSAGPMARAEPALLKASYRAADGIVAVSDGVADDLAACAGISRETVHVIPNPVITPDLECKSRDPVDHAWFSEPSVPVVVAVGRLTAQKDFPTLLRVIELVQRCQPVRLIILGDGPDHRAISALARELGIEDCVELLGFVANPYPYMARASLFVLSSRYEGLPTVLIEALFLGTPVVSTDCPSGPGEIIDRSLLVPVGDPGSLAAAIAGSLAGERRQQPNVDLSTYTLDAAVSRYLAYSFTKDDVAMP